MDLDLLNLSNIDNGGLLELSAMEISKISKNIHDPNTSPTAIREMTITVRFFPDKNRHTGKCRYTLKSKLAAPEPVDIQVNFGVENGQFIVIENTPPEQLTLWGGQDDGSKPKLTRINKESS